MISRFDIRTETHSIAMAIARKFICNIVVGYTGTICYCDLFFADRTGKQYGVIVQQRLSVGHCGPG